MGSPNVAALFVRRDSVYKRIEGVDAWDEDRDARLWPGGMPCVAHPPCAQWGRLAHMAKDVPELKALGPLAIEFVRANGGVLEHPVASRLFESLQPPGGGFDGFGGWTLPVSQQWWGHRAEKRTLLYVVGCSPQDIPPVPLVIGRAEAVACGGAATTIENARRRRQAPPEFRRPSITDAEREHTPEAFAHWLVTLARSCRV